MRHRVKKIKFKYGSDANRMLVRKLARNFLNNSRIETTIKKVKVLKPVIEKLVEKAKIETQANKNYLLKILADKNLVLRMFKEIGQSLKDKLGGYVRIVRLGVRHSDGSEMGRLEWAYPVIKSDKSEKIGSQKNRKSDRSDKSDKSEK
ncbi:50S ribosomal protein L17 [Candidatus Roizmanbacteria bacterium]|nr:50S ribosomal protein L17 [Candidatus Roizmanbacteria bacterium]